MELTARQQPSHQWIDRIIQNRIGSHVLFWLVILACYSLLTAPSYESIYVYLVNLMALLPSQVMAAYLLVYYQIPRLLYAKKHLAFVLSLIGSIYIFTVLARFLTIYFVETVLARGFPKESLYEILTDYFHLFSRYSFVVYLVPFIMLFLIMIKERYDEKFQLEQLLREKTQTELNFLKAQIHPHFLFNTLNNLYTLALLKSDDAPEVVVKLSEMLDYMLYQCNEDRVLVSKEIELIQHYIDLEKLRYGDRLDLAFEYDLDDVQAVIAPLVLLSMVENAFKHGASGDIEQPIVRIHLSVREAELNFEVFNTKGVLVQNDETNFKKGIGQANIKRQLELTYPGKYRFSIHELPESYQVHLSIQL